ncbi:hypothetical protein [Enterococcus bulliens]
MLQKLEPISSEDDQSEFAAFASDGTVLSGKNVYLYTYSGDITGFTKVTNVVKNESSDTLSFTVTNNATYNGTYNLVVLKNSTSGLYTSYWERNDARKCFVRDSGVSSIIDKNK